MTSARMGPLIAALSKMLTSSIDLAKRKAPTVKMADNADTLQSKTIGEHRELYNTETVFPHTDRTNNPHGVTPEQANGYSKSQADALISTTVANDESPIFSYGAPNDYPLDVSGSFDSSLRLMSARNAAMCLEDDGTLSILRNGTDGGTTGVFLAYVPDALAAQPMQPVFTNQRYRAGYFKPTEVALRLAECAPGVIAGWLHDTATDTYGGFISLTDGTMDGSKHRGCRINADMMPILLELTSFVATPQGVVVFKRGFSNESTGQMTLIPFLLPTALFKYEYADVVMPTIIEVTSGKDVYGSPNSDEGSIYLANRISSANIADKPFCHLNGAGLSTAFNFGAGQVRVRSAYDPATGKIYSAILYGFRTSIANVQGQTIQNFQLGFETILSANGLALTFEVVDGKSPGGNIAPLIITRNGNTATGSGAAWTSNVGQNIFGQTEQDKAWAWCSDGLGNAFYYLDDYYNWRPDTFIRQKMESNFYVPVTYPSAPLRIFGSNRTQVNVTKQPAMPSALACLIGPPVLTPWGWIGYGYGSNAAGVIETNMIRFLTGPDPAFGIPEANTFAYKSLYTGKLYGWEPSTARAFTRDLKPNNDYRGMSCTFDEGKPTINAGGPIVLGSLWRINAGSTIDSVGDYTNQRVNISQADIDSLKNQFLQAISALDAQSSALEIVPLPGLGIGSSYYILVLLFVSAAGERNVAFGKAYGPSTNGGLLIVSTGEAYAFGGVTTAQVLTSDAIAAQCSYNTVKMLDGTYRIAGRSGHGTGFTGSSNTIDVRCVLDESGNPIPNTTRARANATQTPNNRGQCYVPTWGFCEVMNSDRQNDDQSKIVLSAIGNPRPQFITWFVNTIPSQFRVLAGVQVASQWTFSFNQAEPCVRRGKYFKIPPKTVNLLDADPSPAGKTFYIYVKPVSLTYAAYTSLQTEGADALYLGTVVCNATQIAEINLEKVVGFGGYRLSTRASSGAIPVSGGLPSRPGTLLWK